MTTFKVGTIVAFLLAILAVVGCQSAAQAPAIPPTGSMVTPSAQPTAPVAPSSARPATPTAQPPTVGASARPTESTAGSDMFITSNPIDLSQIAQISKYRSCAGHDYSGPNVDGQIEANRSMKHYIAPVSALAGSIGKLKALAPFDGTIRSVEAEQDPRGKQVSLSPNSANSWVFIFFHIDLDPALKVGSPVSAGALLGYFNLSQDAHDFDIALKRFPMDAPPTGGGGGSGRATSQGGAQGVSQPAVDSPFLHMSSAVLEQLRGKGIAADSIIVSKSARDAQPCTFQPGSDSPNNWLSLK